MDDAVDGVWLWSGWVFAEEECANGGEDEAKREAAVGVSAKIQLAIIELQLSNGKEVSTDSPPHQSQWMVASNWSSVPGTGVTRVASANDVIFLLTFAFAMAGATQFVRIYV